jgi:hypothetical protein
MPFSKRAFLIILNNNVNTFGVIKMVRLSGVEALPIDKPSTKFILSEPEWTQDDIDLQDILSIRLF